MMATITYNFYHSAKDDVIQFTYQFQGAPLVIIQLPAEVFLTLFNDVGSIAKTFIEEVKKNRAAGIKEDVKTAFNTEEWDKIMDETDDLKGDKKDG